MMKKSILILLATILLWGCAKQGYPSGGPKDVDPPVAGEAVPPSGSTGFGAQEFYIPFDEYVVVKDAENNVLVSPPMKKRPEFVSKGRGLLVRIKDTLKENTTYLFQFKGAVADLNEGNVMESYEYCFSTGTTVDSMSISGSVTDALTLGPREEVVSVMLYDAEASDSAAAKEQPVYITRCDKNGRFRFSHIREGAYRILAIEDENRDMRLTEGEGVAFCDSTVRSIFVQRSRKDQGSDSTAIQLPGRMQKGEAPVLTEEGPRVNLLISTRKSERQRVTKSDFVARGRMLVTTQCALKDFTLAPLGGSSNDLVTSLNAGRDSINIWSRDENCDSIVLVLQAEGLQDTLKMKFRGRGKKSSSLAPTANVAFVKSLIPIKTNYFDSLRLEFTTPLRQGGTTDSVVRVMRLKDSTWTMARIVADEMGLRGVVDFPTKPGEKYELRIAVGALTDIYGHRCDSVKIVTEMTTAEQYGRLIISLETGQMAVAAGGQYVVQLVDDKMKVVQEQKASGNTKLTFEHLKSGKYRLRAIADDNGNGLWDAGDYWQHRQPERVSYFEKTMELRENWDMEETFILKAAR